MPDGTVFPAFIKLEHQRDGSAKASFLAEVEQTLGSAEQRFKAFSSEAQKQLDAALSVKRNTSGSLDLGTEELRAAAQAQQARAVAAREVAAATALAARETGDYSQKARLAVAATEALAREEEQAARAAISHAEAAEQVQAVLNRQASATNLIVQATGRGTEANRMMVNSTRSLRLASVQTGQQLQDIAISLYSGQRASVVFAQQLPQLAFALSGLEGSANKTHDRIGKLATFLSGPWGLAVGLGVGVLFNLTEKLLDSGDAAEEAQRKTYDFSRGLDVLALSAKESANAMGQLVDQMHSAISVQGDFLQTSAAVAAQSVTSLEQRLDGLQQHLLELQRGGPLGFIPSIGALSSFDIGKTQSAIDETRTALESARQAQTNAEIAVSQQRVNEALDAGTKATNDYNRAVGDLNRRLEESVNDPIGATSSGRFISQHDYELQFRRLTQIKNAAIEAARATHGNAATDASIGDMTALIQQLFPGAHITSTTGGKHVAGSDHYAERAIDFVPAGGMGQYTTEQVRQILTDAGVDIRRNRNGTEQLFGPGRSANRPGDHDNHFHVAWEGNVDPERVAAAMQKAQQLITQFGERSAESVSRINEQFDEQPKLIDQAARATRQLDGIISGLRDKAGKDGQLPAGFAQIIDNAEAAKGVIDQALVRPFDDLAKQSQRRLEIEQLLATGRDREADATQVVWSLEDRLGSVEQLRQHVQDLITQGRKDEADVFQRILDQYPQLLANARQAAIEEAKQTEALQRRREELNSFLDTTKGIRSEIEAMVSGRGNVANFGQLFRDLQSKILVERLFGPALRELDEWVKDQSDPFKKSVDTLASETDRANYALTGFADAVTGATTRINAGPATFNDAFNPATMAGFTGPDAFSSTAAGAAGRIRDYANDNGDIVVTGRALQGSLMGLSPDRYFAQASRIIVNPLVDALETQLGVKLPSQLEGALSGALYGYSTGGSVGGVLGGLQGAVDDLRFSTSGLGGLSDALGKGLGGAQAGSTVAGIGNAFGIHLNSTGAELGGAVGSFLPIPGGQIIGAIAGGIIGNILSGIEKGSVTLNGSSITGGTGKSGIRESVTPTAQGVLESIAKIADALGGTVNAGAGRVSIGQREGDWRVDPYGNGQTRLTDRGVMDFGSDADAAVRAATLDLIKDGVIGGIRESTRRLLTSGSDLDAALQKATDFEGVFQKLAELKDPVGAALKSLEDEFKRLRDLFAEANASAEERAQLEELYGLERADLIKRETENLTGSLKGLLQDLGVNNSALSLRDRKALALAEYSPLASRVASGDSTAYDDFASSARTLLDIEQQISGSQSGYQNLLDEVRGLTQGALDRETARLQTNDNQGVVDAVDDLKAEISSQLTAVNDNMGTVIDLLGAANNASAGAAYLSKTDGYW